jgi:sugar (pentulose or hexulose) kinase
MAGIPVICVFDVGKTNKKVLLFDMSFQPVYEQSVSLPETVDEDGFPCEDVLVLTDWLCESYARVRSDARFDIRSINFSGYGASFVLLNDKGQVIAPLYNYLKPYPHNLQEQFYARYGGQQTLCRETASPALGNLNAGLQLYRLKHTQPELFARTQVALHLPNYLSYVLSGNSVSEITSVGCHTHLWDFGRHQYHAWVQQEGITEKLAPLQPCGSLAGVTVDGKTIGVGLHDSSAALIPYLKRFAHSFVLISTGTWSICLNPFNDHPLTDTELGADCLCYLSYEGKQVKASRLFAGQMHEDFSRILAEKFGKALDYFKQIRFDAMLAKRLAYEPAASLENFETAYHQAMIQLMDRQIDSLNLVLRGTAVRQIFVDGGFAQNPVFMGLLTARLPGFSIQAASVAQASALGAAMGIG